MAALNCVPLFSRCCLQSSDSRLPARPPTEKNIAQIPQRQPGDLPSAVQEQLISRWKNAARIQHAAHTSGAAEATTETRIRGSAAGQWGRGGHPTKRPFQDFRNFCFPLRTLVLGYFSMSLMVFIKFASWSVLTAVLREHTCLNHIFYSLCSFKTCNIKIAIQHKDFFKCILHFTLCPQKYNIWPCQVNKLKKALPSKVIVF